MTRRVAVVGAGPAGLAAARAASRAGASVTLVDEADAPGGQYHRGAAVAVPAAVTYLPCASVWAVEPGPVLHLVRGPADGADRERLTLRPDAVVLATGARDRVFPFPGWTLPGVYTAGAAQALAKGERLAIGERVLVAGSGPFLLPVAQSLLHLDVRVVAVLEAQRAGHLARHWLARPWELAATPGKAGELARYATGQLRSRTPYLPGWAVIAAHGTDRVETAVVARVDADWRERPGTRRELAVDAIAVGHGFAPNVELAVGLGCTLDANGFVTVDDAQATSVPGVWAAGELTAIGGAPASVAEGDVAGWCAAGGALDGILAGRRRRDAGRRFTARLAAAHPSGDGWIERADADTVVCRCEDVRLGEVEAALADPVTNGPASVRLRTRAGLGPCQGRTCAATLDALARRTGAPTPATATVPIAVPIRLGELARPVPPSGRNP